MKNLILLALLALAIQTQAQTVIPISNAPYLPSSYLDGSKIVLTARDSADYTIFLWTLPTGHPATNFATLGREYYGDADTVGACHGTTFDGIPNSKISDGLYFIKYTAWDVPVHFHNSTAYIVSTMRVKWNDYEPCIGCTESYAGRNGAVVTDGQVHKYYLEFVSLANTTYPRTKIVFDYVVPFLLHSCPGDTMPQAPASITSPSIPAKTTGKPGGKPGK